jgi:uncharacterized repeat protein (TIGR01451 family)
MFTRRSFWAFVLLGACAVGAHASTCAPAAVRGTAPSDYQSYCWLDFTGYNDALAQGGGQPFTFTLPDGSSLSLTLQVNTNKTSPALTPIAVPSWSGSAIGHSGFSNIPGKPVLYETVSGSTVNAVLANIAVTPPPGSGSSVSYAIVAADGESSNQNESLSFTSNGLPWSLVATITQGGVLPTLNGVGTGTVTETGVAGTVGSYAFASFNNPTQVSTTMVGGGLQGPMFAVRYASLGVTAQLNGSRANAADQFTYTIKSVGGQLFASGTSAGAGAGPFALANLPTVSAGYPLVISESMAPGSASSLASYAVALSCTNLATGASSTVLPVSQSVTTYTFPTLQYGDAVSCVFTNTANRANAAIAKSGPASVSAGSALAYSLLVSNSGPSDASGSLIKDPAVANFLATALACSVASGGAQCPAAASLTIANLQGAGIAIPALPSGSSVTLVVSGTAGNGSGNITNTASVMVPSTIVNSNGTPSSSAATTVTPTADAATTLAFPANANAGQKVNGTVVFANLGLGAASGASFVITLPANLAAPPTLSGLPPGVAYSYAPTTGVVTLTGMPASMAASSALAPISVSYTQPAGGASIVAATFNTTSTDSNPANNSSAVTVGGVAVADLSSALTLTPGVNAGQSVSGTLQFLNSGPSAASGASFSLTLPANLAAPPAILGLPAGVTYSYASSTGVVTFTGLPAALANGAAIGPISFSYPQPAAGSSTVSAAVSATTLDPSPGNNTATLTSTGAAAQLTGTVYTDNNQNALFDSGDTPIAGATVELLIGTRVVATTVTSATGAYTFAAQPLGAYNVAVAPLRGNLADTPATVAVSLVGSSASNVNFGQIPAGAVGALLLTKTTPLTNISAGQSVPYTITATNSQTTPVFNSSLTDLIPAGFRFRAGSGSVNGQKLDPTVNGRQLTWTHLTFAAGEKKIFTLVLTAGAGVVSGEFVNQAMAYNALTSGLISNIASATVRITADPTFDCPDLIGKVFDDANANGIEDPGEKGIAGVRLVTAQGLLVTTDAQGRYHIVCPMLPDATLGSNFIVKVDERTLPSGYRLTTDNPETARLTAGKVSKLNFGAAIHHVVRIEVSDAAFDAQTVRETTLQRIEALVASLKPHPYVVRLAYAASNESSALIDARLRALQSALQAAWRAHERRDLLRAEEEILRPAQAALDEIKP